MFTGLIHTLGTVAAIEREGDHARLAVDAAAIAPELSPGDSVAVNGVCLTAVEIAGERFVADVVAETLDRSSLGALVAQARVNLELPMRAGDRLGGHIVQGHVDAVASVDDVISEQASTRMRIGVPPPLLRYVVEKGSVTLDGVSLTVAAVADASLEVALIPETLARTTLGSAQRGQALNLEVDVIAKHVERLATPLLEAR